MNKKYQITLRFEHNKQLRHIIQKVSIECELKASFLKFSYYGPRRCYVSFQEKNVIKHFYASATPMSQDNYQNGYIRIKVQLRPT